MSKKNYTAEEIIIKLRDVEVLCGQGKTIEEAILQIGVTEQTYYRWLMVDDNEMEIEALALMKNGEGKEGMRLQRLFLEEIKKSEKDLCSCTEKCPYHGKCVDCVMIHRGHGDHLPNCFRPMVNRRIRVISELTENSLENH